MNIHTSRRIARRAVTAFIGAAIVAATPAVAYAQEVSSTTASTSTTSTTVPIKQTTVHGSASDTNACVTSLDPAINPPSNSKVIAALATDAFPQPHLGDPIKLTNTKLTVTVPADVLQQGVDLGFVTDGMKVPSTVDYIVNGNGTKEGSHTYHLSSTVTIHVSGGKAQPLESSLSLPNTTWTPVNKTTNVFFTQKSLTISSTLDLTASLGLVVTATFTCVPTKAPTFVSIGAKGTPPPPPPPVIPTTTSIPPTTVAPTTVAPVSVAALPRTGSSSGPLVAVGVGFLALGLFAVKTASRRRLRHTRV